MDFCLQLVFQERNQIVLGCFLGDIVQCVPEHTSDMVCLQPPRKGLSGRVVRRIQGFQKVTHSVNLKK